MRPTFLARLVNGPLFDPVVYVRLLNLKSALLFDCGRFEGLSNREILSLDSVFISHLHMDHLMGFDHVLRVILHREKPLHVYGPEGVMEKIISRLMSYTWNLTQGYPLRIVIHEVQRHGVNTCTASAQNAFKPSPVSTAGRQGAAIASTPFSSMEAVVLDHNVPCLGFLLKEPFHINIQASRIAEKGRNRAWIGELKRPSLKAVWVSRGSAVYGRGHDKASRRLPGPGYHLQGQ
jgi:ribonuclease Z